MAIERLAYLPLSFTCEVSSSLCVGFPRWLVVLWRRLRGAPFRRQLVYSVIVPRVMRLTRLTVKPAAGTHVQVLSIKPPDRHARAPMEALWTSSSIVLQRGEEIIVEIYVEGKGNPGVMFVGFEPVEGD